MGATDKHRRRIQRELDRNPAWRVRVGNAWLCPYCADAIARVPDPDLPADLSFLEMVTDHLDLCLSWQGFEGTEQSASALKRKARLLKDRDKIRHALMRRPAWQLYDVERRWYCPFCARASSVRVKEGGRISSSVLRRIEEHLADCGAYLTADAEEQPLEHLRAVVAYANRTRKMAEEVRGRIQSDAAWRLRDASGRWVCPFCREVQAQIDFSTSARMVDQAPLEIARHLIGKCYAFGRAARGARLGDGPGGPQAGASSPPAPPAPPRRPSAAKEIVALGRAPATEVVKLSGAPPLEVSGELGAVVDAGRHPSGGEVRFGVSERWSRDERSRISERIRLRPPPGPAGPVGPAAGPLGEDARALSGPPLLDPSLSHPGLDLGSRGGPGRAADPGAPAAGVSDEGRASVDAELRPERSAAEAGGLPEVDGLELRTVARAARSQAEDLLEVVPLEGRRVGIAVGTVSTDGSDRGIYLPLVRNFLRMHARRRRSPRDVLCGVNDDAALGEGGRFVASITYAVVDAGTRTFTVARAGGSPPVLFHETRGGPLVVESPGVVLGVTATPVLRAALEERREALRPGDLVVLHTDGALTAESVDRAPIGREAFLRLVARYGRHEADYFAVKFERFFERWTSGTALQNDATVLAVKLRD